MLLLTFVEKFLILILQVGDVSLDLVERIRTAKDREGGKEGGQVLIRAWVGYLALDEGGQAESEYGGLSSAHQMAGWT